MAAWSFRLERSVTVRILAADLLPAVRSRLMVELGSRDVDPSLWTPIDVRADEVRAPLLRRAYAAEADVLTGLERCARAPTYASALRALRALEELHDVREGLDPLFDIDQLARARHTLAWAVKAVVPYSACHLIGLRIREAFETELAVSPYVDIAPDFALYSTRGQPWSHPIWDALCMKEFGGTDPLDAVFVPGVQEAYEQVRARTDVEAACATATAD